MKKAEPTHQPYKNVAIKFMQQVIGIMDPVFDTAVVALPNGVLYWTTLHPEVGDHQYGNRLGILVNDTLNEVRVYKDTDSPLQILANDGLVLFYTTSNKGKKFTKQKI